MQLPNNAVSVADAAKMIGIQPIRIRKLMREGKIKGVKIKKYWYCDLDSVREYVSKNVSHKSKVVEINGERAVPLKMFCEKRGISATQKLLTKLNTIKLNGMHYVTNSEARRYDNRFTEYFGRAIVSQAEAAKRLGKYKGKIHDYIADNELQSVKVDGKIFVFVDSLERFEERLQAGERFLRIPKINLL